MHCVRYRTVNGGAGRKSRFTLSRKKNKKAGIAPGLLLLLVFSFCFSQRRDSLYYCCVYIIAHKTLLAHFNFIERYILEFVVTSATNILLSYL